MHDQMSRITERTKSWVIAISLAVTLSPIVFLAYRLSADEIWVLAAVITLLAFSSAVIRLLGAILSKPTSHRTPLPSSSLVMCVYNEDPELFRRVLDGISSQTSRPQRVWIVDDGSEDPTCFEMAKAWATEVIGHLDVRVHRMKVNRGKRRAQAVAFQQDDADIFVTLDSDTVMEPDALLECLKPFRDTSVQGVAALIIGINWRRSMLTRLVDLDLVNQFLVGRAVASTLGSVLATCGSLAAYRAAVCRDFLDEYLNERFLGAPVRNGDDRKLTQFGLLRGKVVFQPTAVARTALPESINHLARQRFRWFTSFYRGSYWMIRNMSARRLSFWLTLCHVAIFIAETAILASLVIFAGSMDWRLVFCGIYLYAVPLSYIRSVRYLHINRADMSGSQQVRTYLFSPLVTLFYVFLLVPLRLLAAVGVRSWNWRTRNQVEVGLET